MPWASKVLRVLLATNWICLQPHPLFCKMKIRWDSNRKFQRIKTVTWHHVDPTTWSQILVMKQVSPSSRLSTLIRKKNNKHLNSMKKKRFPKLRKKRNQKSRLKSSLNKKLRLKRCLNKKSRLKSSTWSCKKSLRSQKWLHFHPKHPTRRTRERARNKSEFVGKNLQAIKIW
jgi:hypothetical protein